MGDDRPRCRSSKLRFYSLDARGGLRTSWEPCSGPSGRVSRHAAVREWELPSAPPRVVHTGIGNLFPATATMLMNAYGKSQSTAMGQDDALRRAAVLAKRDATALLIMPLDKATGISSLSRESLSSVAASPGPAMSEPAL